MLTAAEQQCDLITGSSFGDTIVIVAGLAAFCFAIWVIFRDSSG